MDVETNEVEETQDAGDSRLAALEAAWGAKSDETPETPAPAVEADAVEAPEVEAEEKPGRARDESGRFAKSQKEKVAPAAKGEALAGAPKQTAKPTAPTAAAPVAQQSDAPKPAALKAPASWKPAAREHWDKLPPEVQQEAVRRDRETAQALQQAAQKAKVWEPMEQAVAPYQHVIAKNGGNLAGIVGNALQTIDALSDHRVDHVIASLITNFRANPQRIAAILQGQPVQQQAQQQSFDPSQFAQQVQQNLLKELESRREAAALQRAEAELESWGQDKEFLEEVRDTMADMMEVAARRGVGLSQDDAYAAACKLHPDVSQVLAQREAAKAANAQVASTQRARAAASSVRSRPAAAPTAQQPEGRVGALSAAWDALSGR